VHPIEHLRYLARADSSEAAALVAETAAALAGLRGDHATLVVAARRIIERHPTVGPLWWLCAHLLVAPDARQRAWELSELLADDPTPDELAEALPHGAAVLTGGFTAALTEAFAEREVVAMVLVDGDDSLRLARRLGRFGIDVEPVEQHGVEAAAARADMVVVGATAGSDSVALGSPDAAAAARAGARAAFPVWLIEPGGTRLPSRFLSAIEAAGCHEFDLGAVARRVGAPHPPAPLAPELLRAVTAR